MTPPRKTPDQWVHGASTYTNHGCRCDICKQGHNRYINQLRYRRSKMDIPAEVEHGSVSTYCNWSCRCQPCKDANAARGRKDRRKAA